MQAFKKAEADFLDKRKKGNIFLILKVFYAAYVFTMFLYNLILNIY